MARAIKVTYEFNRLRQNYQKKKDILGERIGVTLLVSNRICVDFLTIVWKGLEL